MKATAAIARQLRLLCDDFDDADRLATGLTELGADLAAVVPSCVSVSIWAGVAGSDVPVRIGIHSAAAAPVLASLAVPRSLSEPGDMVLLQASEAGAFLLLADDLRVRLDPRLALRIDEHLNVEIESAAGEWKSSMDDLSAVNRAVGVLIERGLLPADAYVELSRRAQQDGMGLAAASRSLLESL